MKNLKYFISVIFLVISASSYSQLKVISNGSVGINNSAPTYKLDVNGSVRFITGSYAGINTGILFGTIYTDGVLDPLYDNRGIIGYNYKWNRAYINNIWTAVPVTVSDEKVKENISPVTDALSTIMKLNGVKYDLKDEYFIAGDEKLAGKTGNDPMLKNRIGFVAQEMAQVLPNLVVFDSLKQVHGIVYENLIPVLVEAIKEQQAQIEGLKAELAGCCQDNLKSGSINSTDDEKSTNISEAKLYQNNPNPFSIQTTVKFEIPETVQSTQLHICNMTGTLLKTITINQRGIGKITISANEFVAGMYLFSLVCDVKIVDTKQMLLTK